MNVYQLRGVLACEEESGELRYGNETVAQQPSRGISQPLSLILNCPLAISQSCFYQQGCKTLSQHMECMLDFRQLFGIGLVRLFAGLILRRPRRPTASSVLSACVVNPAPLPHVRPGGMVVALLLVLLQVQSAF